MANSNNSRSIHLLDNSFYPSNFENCRSIPDNLIRVKGKRGVNDNLNFIDLINGRTIQELNEKKKGEGGILVWPHSFKECDGELEKMTVLECRFDSEKNIVNLHTGNLVGWIGDGKIQLEINSRFSSGNKKQDFFLYYMLSKVFCANIVNMDVGSSSVDGLNLLYFVFPRLLKEAMVQGLFKQYVKREYNDSNVRGTIDVNRHLRYNKPANGRIAYRTREFSYDNSITQLLRHTIEYMSSSQMGRAILNGNKETEYCARMVVQATPTYQKGKRFQVIADNRKPVTHPYFTRYKSLQRVCLAILRKELRGYGTQDSKVNGMLIDVAWLWEEYIAGVLAKKTNFKHHTRENAFHLLRKEDNTVFQTVIPDYLDEGNKYVADAKYIPLHKYDHLDAERAEAVYYKTIMYMHRFGSGKGFLFHPCNNDDITWIRDNKNYNHIKIDTTTIACDYKVVGTDSWLHEVGMIIPGCEDYKEFCGAMQRAEEDFLKKIEIAQGK